MNLRDLVKGVGEKLLGPPKLIVYGNCETCLIEFKGERKVYSNLRDVTTIVNDFKLSGRRVIVEAGGELLYDNREYYGMRPIPLSNFRTWLRAGKVRVD